MGENVIVGLAGRGRGFLLGRSRLLRIGGKVIGGLGGRVRGVLLGTLNGLNPAEILQDILAPSHRPDPDDGRHRHAQRA
jgi:hypothetical protein